MMRMTEKRGGERGSLPNLVVKISCVPERVRRKCLRDRNTTLDSVIPSSLF